MSPEVIKLARQMLLGSKGWGLTCERAIVSGQWDQGSLIQGIIPEAEKHLLRNREETEQ